MHRERMIRSFDGTELFTSVHGEGYPMIFCDGLGCDGFIWRYALPEYQKRFQIIRWHYRGHGLSAAPRMPGNLSVEALVKDLREVVDFYGIEEAVFVGHSMGVQVILEYALQHPEHVRGLIPMCGGYGHPLQTFHDNALADRFFPFARKAIRKAPKLAQRVWSGFLASEAAYQLGKNVELNRQLIARHEFKPYFEHLAGMDVDIFWGLLENLNKHTTEDRLHTLQKPTLVVAGEKDTFSPAWLSTRMWKLLPDAELLMVPSGSHVAPLEIPELLHLRINEFLRTKLSLPPQEKKKAKTVSTRSKKTTKKTKRAPAKQSRTKTNAAATQTVVS